MLESARCYAAAATCDRRADQAERDDITQRPTLTSGNPTVLRMHARRWRQIGAALKRGILLVDTSHEQTEVDREWVGMIRSEAMRPVGSGQPMPLEGLKRIEGGLNSEIAIDFEAQERNGPRPHVNSVDLADPDLGGPNGGVDTSAPRAVKPAARG